jgi:hypothetical protein
LDACLNTCQFAWCGDGYVQTGVELCDEGIYNGAGVGNCLGDCSGIQTVPETPPPAPGLTPGATAGIATASSVAGLAILGGGGTLLFRAFASAATVARFRAFLPGGGVAQGQGGV